MAAGQLAPALGPFLQYNLMRLWSTWSQHSTCAKPGLLSPHPWPVSSLLSAEVVTGSPGAGT